MFDDLVGAPLTFDQIDLAFPIIQAHDRTMTLAVWRRYAMRLLLAAPGSGISGVFRGRYVHGLFAYHSVPCPSVGGDLMLVDLVVYADLINQCGVVDRLIGAIDEVSQALGTCEVHLILPQQPSGQTASPLRHSLLRAGHRREGEMFCKRFSCASA